MRLTFRQSCVTIVCFNLKQRLTSRFKKLIISLTMSLCSKFALFSSNSLTTSMCPSFAAEISAVQQSCTKCQPVTLRTPIRHYTQVSPFWIPSYLPAGRTRCSWGQVVALIHKRVTRQSKTDINYRIYLFCSFCLRSSKFECVMCNSRLYASKMIIRGVWAYECVCWSGMVHTWVCVCRLAPEDTRCLLVNRSCHLVKRAKVKVCNKMSLWLIITELSCGEFSEMEHQGRYWHQSCKVDDAVTMTTLFFCTCASTLLHILMCWSHVFIL